MSYNGGEPTEEYSDMIRQEERIAATRRENRRRRRQGLPTLAEEARRAAEYKAAHPTFREAHPLIFWALVIIACAIAMQMFPWISMLVPTGPHGGWGN